MSDQNSGGPDRVDVELPVPLPVNPVLPGAEIRGISFDRITADQAQVSGELSGGPGVRTEWDAASFDSAATWLQSHGEYVRGLSTKMHVIAERLGGDGKGQGPLGGYPAATELLGQHRMVHESTRQGLAKLADDLYAAAEALRAVKRNYETAEEANAMSAQRMNELLRGAGGQGGGADR
ncbi:hypothetical protein [Micromonospora siamensis]|uniref:Excreted virulence factor EspC, type VII ESX diderm n=1 Tax=Micromonospora siamensis TaxID=299152 RepID=A0A1C5H6F1_9ACTN|nr:hypothetical protein [Micromonospora siamensis]SCG41602.1 hypothetical protein GA0074704_1148 [Micromonospora siamensis]